MVGGSWGGVGEWGQHCRVQCFGFPGFFYGVQLTGLSQSFVGTFGFLISENQGLGFFILCVIHGRLEVAYKTHKDLVCKLLGGRGLLCHVLHILWASACAWHMVKAYKYAVFA